MNETETGAPKVGVVWFTYREDEALLLESVASVKRAICTPVKLTVVDDGFCAISNESRATLEAQGVIYRKTFYPRSGNLLGPENLKGQVKEMVEAGKGCDILVKIDSDTLLLRTDWLEALYRDPRAIMVGSYKGLHNYPMGHCYAVKTAPLEALNHDVNLYPAWAGCFEDYEIGTRLHRIANGDYDYAVRYRSGVEDGFWLCSPAQVDPRAKEARVISCGFDYGAAKDKRAYKAAQLAKMREVNSWIEA